jgi:succinate dehydrogenase / fumarate reductase iron-sulfur subunit
VLGQLHRFLTDPRDERDGQGQDLERENSSDGVWGCHTVLKCNEVCPRSVRPADGIRGLRWRLLARRARRLLVRK